MFSKTLFLAVLLGGAVVTAGIGRAQQPQSSAAPSAEQAADSGMQVKVFSLQRGDAITRAEMLQALLGQGSSLARSLRLAADPRSNSIIAVGIPSDLEVIRGVLAALDQPAPARPISPQLASAPPGPSAAGAAKAPPRVQPSPADPEFDRLQRELNEAELRLKEAKSELERLEQLRDKNPAAIVFTQVAKAQLAAIAAEAQAQKLRQSLEQRKQPGLPPILRSVGR
jgi:type II secretory pathway component GspD/PulD (secretin)